ncbi:Suppressor of Sensor Kinase (SLN1) [Allomyces javanicus]|nr:Suppressor of Sensor Kinase (SLN1) [Allomyces javanicus]
MVGILLNKLRHLGTPAAAATAAARPSDATVHAADYDDDLFHLACLKLAIFMYHPHERAKYVRYRRRLPHARDLRSRFIYKHDAADDHENTPRHSRASRGSRSRSQSSLASSTKRSHSRPGRVTARSRAAAHQRDHSPAESALSLRSDQQLLTAPLYPLGPAPPPPPPPPPDGTTTPNGSGTPARRSSAAAKWLHKHLPRTSSWIARLNPPADSRDSASILDLGPDDEDDDEDDFLVVHLAKPDLANDDDNDSDDDDDNAQPAAAAPTSATADPPPPQTNNSSSDAASLASMSPTRSSTDIHVRDGLRWRLEELIGEGAVGLVYRATLIPDPPLTPVPVAVKHLHLPSTNPHLNRRNFEQLIAALSLADHPNIIAYLGSHIMDDDCFLLMELCEGGTLSDWIRRNGPLRDRAKLVEYIRQMVSGLEFMHRHGVIHRDLKTSNIMWKDGVLKIADFSSAKFHGLCCRKVHDARVVGTPSYLAPEIVAGHQMIEIKGAQDIWSLGCSIYELIMGKPPFSEVDNVWSLYFVLGSYASINIPPPRPSSRLRAIFGLRPLNGTTATTPTSTPASPPIKFTTPAAPLVPAKPAPVTADDADDADDAPSALDTVQSEGIPALLGGAATLRRQQYRYTARDAVGLDSAHEQALVVTPCDEDEDPLAKVEIPAELTTLSRQRRDTEEVGGEVDALPAGAIVGNDAQGYVKYKFLEPLFPMVKNHHPLLSQLCQAGAVDPVALDFMAKCLAWDPRARGTAAQLLAHPLLKMG